MKILHLIYDDLKNPWLGGGGAVRTYEIYKRLSKKHEITVVVGNFPRAKKEEEISGILYKRIGSDRGYICSRLTYILNVWKSVRVSDYDIVVEDFSAFSPTLSRLYSKVPVIASIQNLYSTHAIKKYGLIGIAPFVLEKFVVRAYKHYIVVSQSLKRILEKTLGVRRNIRVIPNGVDDLLFSLKSSEEEYILFLGRIDIYQKGIDILIKAFKEILKCNKNINLIIAGGGKREDIQNLQNLIYKQHLKSNVKYLGKVDKEKKYKLLSKCLFVCMPSRFESWGIVATEAQACGKPVLGTRIAGLTDSVLDGVTGILVEPENPKKLTEGMRILIEDERLRKKMGVNARKWAKKFSWDVVAREQERFYYDVILYN